MIYDMSIHTNPDAQAWAKFFIKTKNEMGWTEQDIDEGLMIGWFANAMGAMHDYLKPECQPVVLPDGSAFFVDNVETKGPNGK
jgi:hypothetical protein